MWRPRSTFGTASGIQRSVIFGEKSSRIREPGQMGRVGPCCWPRIRCRFNLEIERIKNDFSPNFDGALGVQCHL